MSFELFQKYLGYSSPSNMYKALNETKNPEQNKAKVNIIENKLTNLIKLLKNSPTNDAKKFLKITCWKLLRLFFTLIN